MFISLKPTPSIINSTSTFSCTVVVEELQESTTNISALPSDVVKIELQLLGCERDVIQLYKLQATVVIFRNNSCLYALHLNGPIAAESELIQVDSKPDMQNAENTEVSLESLDNL